MKRILLLLALGLAPPPAAAQALHDVTFAVPAYSLSFGLQYLADDLGLWEKHGLKVKSLLIAGVGAANAVISGSADAADASPPTITRAAAHGQKLLALAALQDHLFLALVLYKDIAERDGFDPKAPLEKRAQVLKDRTIAVDSINSIIHAYVLLLAHRGGVPFTDVRIAPMQPPNMVAAFDTGSIDGYDMSLPWPLIPVLSGKGVAVASGIDGDPPDMEPFANAFVIVRGDACETRPWLCRGLGGAIADAASYLHEHPDDAQKLLAKHFPTLDPKLLAAGFAAMLKVTPSPPAPVEAEFANGERLNIEAGLLAPADQLKSFDGLFTDKYVK